MIMVTRTEAIKKFLIAESLPDLAALYHHDMEVQVNVAQDNGDKIDGEFKGKRWHGYTDGFETWKSFRIPYKANTEPEYKDVEIKFNLEKHVEGIGMTGWNWVSKKSHWVAFDFDSITGHSDRHEKKLTDSELKEIRKVVSEIPWITVRNSTSGKGIHLYVHLDPLVSTKNHTEHAALARAILGLLNALTGFNFLSKVDACGGNMWVWHRKMRGTSGLLITKSGTPLSEVPANWKDHLNVISGRKKRCVPTFIQESNRDQIEDLFEELSGQRTRIELDQEHKRLITYLQDSGANWWWDQDHHMLVTHTVHLKEAYEELKLKGVFDTVSTGKDRGADHNCFMYPMRRGAWAVRRYSPGTSEADSWEQDQNGWTRCFYNKVPDLRSACRTFQGIEDTDGSFVFREAEIAAKAAKLVGVDVLDSLPSKLLTGRETRIKTNKDGRLIIQIEHDKNDVYISSEMQGWLVKSKNWQKVFNSSINNEQEEVEIGNFDDTVRHLVTETGEDFGWVMKIGNNMWRAEPLTHIKTFLYSLGITNKEVTQIIGSCVAKCWVIVNRPFQPEYIGDRKWNRNAAQLRFAPNENKENLSYPTWKKILDHCGSGIDSDVKESKWCKVNGITTGADYLKCWIASLIQEPTEPLPYLFFYSKAQSTGKSTFHEALELLMTTGVERADAALINQSGFNAEIENAVLCVVEEVDLNKNRQAYNRIKDWVTSRKVSIHRKGQTPYSIINTTHWIQCANNVEYCPIFAGDSRITMVEVPSLEGSMMTKKEMFPLLEKEAPDFLSEVINLEIPRSEDRLNIPVIETGIKKRAQDMNRSLLEVFLDEQCFYVPGALTKFSVFFDKFQDYIPLEELHNWSKPKVGRELPKDRFIKGRNPQDLNQVYIGNLSFTPGKPDGKYILNGDNLEKI